VMPSLIELSEYLVVVFNSWFGIVGAILTLLEIVRSTSSKSIPISPKVYRVCLALLIIVAQFVAYRSLMDEKRKAEAQRETVGKEKDALDQKKDALEKKLDTAENTIRDLRGAATTSAERMSQLASPPAIIHFVQTGIVDSDSAYQVQLEIVNDGPGV